MQLVIERKKWSRKVYGNKVFDGEKYCIQGFIGKAIGIPDEEMLGEWNLGKFVHKYPSLKWLYKKTKFRKYEIDNQTILMTLNDSATTPESELLNFLRSAKFDVKII